MEDISISAICSGDIAAATPFLEEWNKKNAETMKFPELDSNDRRVQVWSGIFDFLKNSSSLNIHLLCLQTVRILSRDKTDLENILCEKWINVLLELSGLYQLTVTDEEQLLEQSPPDVVKIEALKCLCNLVYNSPTVQNLCASNCMIEGIIARCKTYKVFNIPHEIKHFDMRLLFIITALRPEKRDTVKNEYHGLIYLIECLDEIVKEVTPYEGIAMASPGPLKVVAPDGTAMSSASSREDECLYNINDIHLDLACEILKTLFNLVLKSDTSEPTSEQEEVYMLRLVTVCFTLLLCAGTDKDKERSLQNNVVNFLTSVPSCCYSELAPMQTDDTSPEFEFEARNMIAVHRLIDYLQYKLSVTQNFNVQHENLSPILGVMHKAASSYPYLRKYLRAVILPPLRDVHVRPEQGNSVRARLCRLLTSPVPHVRDLTAQFLFILCKENVSRMVKYTGYGNAAGLFATCGLLGPDKQRSSVVQYSDDSEDSDTEEYLAMRHTINPVTGCYEPPRADPMAGCTEEQKEYEAMKLVNLMDQLNKAGIVQPCRIGPDGKPQPVEHIMELQEDLPQQQIHNNNNN